MSTADRPPHVAVEAAAIIALVLACATGAPAQVEPGTTILVAPAQRTPTSPTIDGALDDACWTRAPALAGFTRVGVASPASQPTVVRVAFDDRALYIAFVCYEPNPDELAHAHSGRDADVWFDDSVELFIDPEHSHERYYQLAANCVGATFDRHMEDIGWTAPWRVETAIGTDRWTAELSIPFAALDCHAPDAGDVFAVNFCRNRKTSTPGAQTHGEWSSWAPVDSQYHEPHNFGHLVFADDPTAIPIGLLHELAASALCTGGEPLTRPVRMVLAEGALELTPHRMAALSELSGAQSAIAGALEEVERLLAGERWADEETRRAFEQRHAELAQTVQRLRDGLGEDVDALQLQRLHVRVEELTERADALLWDARFELLFAGVEMTDAQR